MKLYNRMEAAEKLGVQANTIEKWAKDGRIRVIGWSRNKPIFTEEALEEVLSEQKRYGIKIPLKKQEEDSDVEPVPA